MKAIMAMAMAAKAAIENNQLAAAMAI